MSRCDSRSKSCPCSLVALIGILLAVGLPLETRAVQSQAELPSALDWRDHGGNYCPPVRDRGDCDSSWAFAAIAALESRYAVATDSPGRFIDLSEQTLISCQGGSLGCSGGSAEAAAQFLQNQGAPPERCFPYVGGVSDCANACPNWSPRAIQIASYYPVSPTIEALKTELQNGPFQVGFDFYNDLQFYAGGVYEYTSGKFLAKQSALLVGYADDPGHYGGGYFWALYSFGPSWGEQGFLKIGYSQVTGVVGFGQGAYAYNVFLPTADASEGDDSSDTARPIASGEVQIHSLLPAFDEDWVVFTTTAKADITLATSGPAGSSTQMQIYDAWGEDVGCANAVGQYASLTLPLKAGVYRARITPSYPDEILSCYFLSLSVDAWPYEPPALWLRGFSPKSGGWTSQDQYPRMLGDVNGDGKDDVVGFGSKGVYVSLSSGAGFGGATLWITNFGDKAGGWTSQDLYPRMMGDVNDDGKADLVGFGNKGVYVALSTGKEFAAPAMWISNYSVKAGGWTSQNLYPRCIADVNGDGKADVVGFGHAGVYVSLSTGNSFGAPTIWLSTFGRGAGGWTSQDLYPRTLADVNGDGKSDIVGFGNKGVYISLSTGTGLGAAKLSLADFGTGAGGWACQDAAPRMLADTDANQRADIVGFNKDGAMISLRDASSFSLPSLRKHSFGVDAGGWSSQNSYPRAVGDVNGDGKADLVGFGSVGVYVAIMP